MPMLSEHICEGRDQREWNSEFFVEFKLVIHGIVENSVQCSQLIALDP
jgi:hypothetical protein